MFPGGKIPGEDVIFSWYTIAFSLAIGMVFGLRNYMKGPQSPTREMLEKRTAIVTGASSGVGLEIAKDLACRGARVILACRDEAKGKAAEKEVTEHAKSKRVHFLKLDLSSFESIRNFVTEFKSSNKRLNFLINNAGVMYHPEGVSADGHEIHFQVNYLGHFLLTHLLVDLLKKSAPARVVHTTCPAYALGEIHWDNLGLEGAENKASAAFAQSKLANMLFNRKLAKYLEGSDVTSNVVHPGICKTDIYRNMPFMQSKVITYTFSPVLWFLMKRAKDGAQTAIQCAVAKEEEGVSGKFYQDCVVKVPDEKVNDDEAAERLWQKSLELVGITLPDDDSKS